MIQKKTDLTDRIAVETYGSRSSITIFEGEDGDFITLDRDDIAPLVRFLRAHFPEQVAEGLRDKEVTE